MLIGASRGSRGHSDEGATGAAENQRDVPLPVYLHCVYDSTADPPRSCSNCCGPGEAFQGVRGRPVLMPFAGPRDGESAAERAMEYAGCVEFSVVLQRRQAQLMVRQP